MKQETAIQYLKRYRDYLYGDGECSKELIEALVGVSEESIELLCQIPFKNPTTYQLISFLVGSIGVDRFMVGDKKNAIKKYFTLGGLGVWWIKDVRSAKQRCREYNCKKLMEAIKDPSVVQEMISHDIKMKTALAVGVAVIPTVVKTSKSVQDTFYVN